MRNGFDDTIIINGKTYPGIKGGLDSSGRSISDERKFPPLEITDIVPFDKKFTLKIQLANHGILFGNSDIYIVVKWGLILGTFLLPFNIDKKLKMLSFKE